MHTDILAKSAIARNAVGNWVTIKACFTLRLAPSTEFEAVLTVMIFLFSPPTTHSLRCDSPLPRPETESMRCDSKPPRGECAGAPNYEFVRQPTQGVSKLHTTTRGCRDPTSRTRQAGPPTNLPPAMRTTRFAWTLVPAPPPSRQFPNRLAYA